MRSLRLVSILALTACHGAEPAAAEPSTPPAASTPPPAIGDGPVNVTVKIESAGSVRGRVTSEPPGLACEDTCSASFPAGTELTLTFEPLGAASFAQVEIREGEVRSICGGGPAAASTTCVHRLTTDTSFRVFPISVPPPAPPR